MSLPNAVLAHDTMPELGWQIALASVLKLSGGLSTLGSIWIISKVLRRANDLRHSNTKSHNPTQERSLSPFYRLMFGMSLCDALCSSWLFASSWALPAGYWWGAVGNQGTCIAQGFFIHLSLAVPVYNASLSLYYMLQIKYHWSDVDFSKKIEPWMHLIANGNALAYAFLAVGIDMVHPSGPLCLDSYDPKVCDAADPTGDCVFQVRWSNIFTTWWYTVVFTSMFFAAGAMLVVYRAVRKMEKRMERYDFALQASAAAAAASRTCFSDTSSTTTPLVTAGKPASVPSRGASSTPNNMSSIVNTKPSTRAMLFAESLSALDKTILE